MTEPSWLLLALAVALVLGLAATAYGLARTEAVAVAGRFPQQADRSTGRSSRGRNQPVESRPALAGRDDRQTKTSRAAVIVNPTKFDDVSKVRAEVERICRSNGWELVWLETTVDDPGEGQAREAVRQGVDLVCSLGGDGTVRTVGSALIDSGVPLGLLPGGTGNLLARNLNLPIDSVSSALTVALTGTDTRIDTCSLTLVRPTTAELRSRFADETDPAENVDMSDAVDDRTSEDVTEDHRFMVMAGLGFDAEVMAGAPEQLKAKLGWVAYLVAGFRHLRGPQFVVAVRTDAGMRLRRRVRSVMVGNVGKLQGGMTLLPDAKSDDGVMNVILLSPQGIVGWGAVFARIASRRRKGHRRVDYHTCREVQISSTKPVEIQLDGDTMGSVKAMTVKINPRSLVVRLPRKGTSSGR